MVGRSGQRVAGIYRKPDGTDRPPGVFSRSMNQQPTGAPALDRLLKGQRVGFLFSGGASRCIFQVGVAETLAALGIHPQACLGVSAGAWNAAAVAVGNTPRLRAYWRFFSRMPYLDFTNIFREHSPFIWRRLHQRAFRRYVDAARLRHAPVPVLVALTRLRDRELVIVDARTADDPLEVLLASNYLPPFYTHAPVIDGERYGDGAIRNNVPYEALFERGCDFVVLVTQKAECEGGLFRNLDDPDHVIPEEYRDRVVVIRPRHPLDLAFVERSWRKLAPFADYGAMRAREILLGLPSSEPEACLHGRAAYLTRIRRLREGITAFRGLAALRATFAVRK